MGTKSINKIKKKKISNHLMKAFFQSRAYIKFTYTIITNFPEGRFID